MNREDDPQLWDALGKSVPPAASPFFARNILREIRVQPGRFGALKHVLFRPRVALLSGLAAMLIVLGVGVHATRPVRQSHVASVAKVNADDDFDSDIDDLVAVSDDNDDDDVAVL